MFSPPISKYNGEKAIGHDFPTSYTRVSEMHYTRPDMLQPLQNKNYSQYYLGIRVLKLQRT